MVGREKEITFMAKVVALVLLCLMSSLASQIQAQSLERGKKEIAAREREYNKRVNIGIKGGFRSTTYIVSDFLVDGVRIEDTQKNYKLGYYAALFARFNFKRRFIQTEVSYDIDRAEVVLDKGSLSSNTQHTTAGVSSNIHSLNFPLMYGYYFVRNGPYTLSAFGGPKLEYLIRSNIDYNQFEQSGIQEKLHPLNVAVTAGISVSISNVFFDFRYDQELLNISKKITYAKQNADGTNTTGEIKFHRRGNSLSFSFGILF